jgi:hypothetical protein
MTNQEAKFILSAYRPSGEDAADPSVAEALEQARRDPELAQWFASERAFDVAMSDALCSTPLPAGLRENILAGGKISRTRVWRPRPAILALAAAVVVAAMIAGVWMNRASGLDTWQRDALAVIPAMLTGEAKFDYESNDGRALQQWLQAQHAPAPAALPAMLQALPALGCKRISSAGRPVSIICFQLHTGELVHLIVTDGSDPAHGPPQQPRFRKYEDWITATWSENGRAGMLATKASKRELRELLETTAQTAKARLPAATKI